MIGGELFELNFDQVDDSRRASERGRLWGRLVLPLHRLVTPVVMLVMFVAMVVPIGLIMRLFGKDPLRLRLDPAATTYWIDREPPDPQPGTMKNQH